MYFEFSPEAKAEFEDGERYNKYHQVNRNK